MKKCVEMREMLFKNWKWLFKITNQTPPKSFWYMCLKIENYCLKIFMKICIGEKV